jgi:hypothetical protein
MMQNFRCSTTHCGSKALLFLLDAQIIFNSQKYRKNILTHRFSISPQSNRFAICHKRYLLIGVFYNRYLVNIDSRRLHSIRLDACGSNVSSAWVHKRGKKFLCYKYQCWRQIMSSDYHCVRFKAKSESFDKINNHPKMKHQENPSGVIRSFSGKWTDRRPDMEKVSSHFP